MRKVKADGIWLTFEFSNVEIRHDSEKPTKITTKFACCENCLKEYASVFCETLKNVVHTLHRDHKLLFKPKKILTVRDLEKHMEQSLPLTATSVITYCEIPQRSIETYGIEKHKHNMCRARNLPGVELLKQIKQSTCSRRIFLIAAPDAIKIAQESIELVAYHSKVPSDFLNEFRKPNFLKEVAHISHCNIYLQEKKNLPEMVLTGLQCEIYAAELLLNEELSTLVTQKKGSKVKSKKKGKNSAAGETKSGANKAVENITSVGDTEEKDLTKTANDTADKIDELYSLEDIKAGAGDTEVSSKNGDNSSTNITNVDVSFREEGIVDCVVCLSEKASMAFLPCGHLHTCPACAKRLFESDGPYCPTCRGEIKHYCRIWI